MRGEGITTRQMKAAPNGALFIWCSEQLDYPRQLACELNRADLHIVRPSWLTGMAYYGMRYSGVIVDHAAQLTDHQSDCLRLVRTLR